MVVKNNSPLFLIIFIIALQLGCKQSKNCKGFNMVNSDWLHYKLNDHIIFKSANGSDREYIVDKADITDNYKATWSDLNGKEPLCSAVAVMEAHSTNVANGSKEVKTLLRIDMRDYSEDETTKQLNYEYGLSFGNGTSRAYFIYFPTITFLDTTIVLHDSLFLNNKWHKEVIEVTRDTVSISWIETWKWYFSRREGFIGFKDRSCQCDYFAQ